MLLSERWRKKVQSYELQAQMKRLMIEARKLEYSLNVLRGEHEEHLKAAHNLSFELSDGPFQVLKSSPIFDSNEMEETHDPCSSHVNSSCHDLFHDEPIHHVVCELNDPPIFDIYELEEEALSSWNVSSAENEEGAAAVNKDQGMKSDLWGFQSKVLKSVLDEGNAFLSEEAKSDAKCENSLLKAPKPDLHSTITALNGLNPAPTHLSFADLIPPMHWESYFAACSYISSVRGSKQSRKISLKNCYAFKRKGVFSLPIFLEVDQLKPGVQNGRVIGDDAAPGHSIQSWFAQADSAQDVPSTSEHYPTTFKDPSTHEPGLLNFYIEDDELVDVEELFQHLTIKI